MNVLDWRGPAFLQLYVTLLVIAVTAALLLRWWLRQPGGLRARGAIPALHPFEIAYMAGGPRGVTDAAIASLLRRGSIEIQRGKPRLRASTLRPVGVTPLEEAVYEAVRTSEGKVGPIRKATRGITATVATRIRELGLAMTPGRSAQARLLPMLVMLAVLGLGVAKIFIGYWRDRDIGFLVALTVATFVIGVAFLIKIPILTRRGSRMLDRIRNDNAALRTTAASAPSGLSTTDALLAFALFGSAAVHADDMRSLHHVLQPPASGGSGCGGGSSGCGGGSCGGGGGGCGGCGGGD